MNIPMHHIPILRGKGPNAKAIAIAEEIVKALKSGELVNLAVVAERRDGEPVMSFDLDSSVPGEALKMRGAIALLGSMLDKKMMGG